MIEFYFIREMAAAGLATRDAIIADGKLHRIDIVGDKPGSMNGWYIIFPDGVPSGAFGSWKVHTNKNTWCAKTQSDMTSFERAEFKRKMYVAQQEREKEENARKALSRKKAIALWQSTGSAKDTWVERYLQGRGINHLPSSLRFHPACYHTPTKMNYSTMVAAVTRWPDAVPYAVHRTFLSKDKKAPIQPNKMMLGPVSGGAVRLGLVSSIVVVAEGIETALTVQQEMGIPAWAVLSASNYKPLILPDAVREIIIAADHDPVGINAAQEAAAQWARQGLVTKVVLPPIPGTDFNDLLMEKRL